MATRDRYAVIGDLELNTPAWEVTSYADMYSGPQVRGDDRLVPSMAGLQVRRRIVSAARKVLPITVLGHYDWTGAPYADPAVGLVENIDRLKRAFRPRQGTTTVEMLFHVGDGTIRSAEAVVLLPLQIDVRGPGFARGLIDVVVPEGVLRSTVSETDDFTGPGDFTVNNPGSADEYTAVIELSGGPVTLTNESWGGDPTLTYLGSDPVTIRCGNFTAKYADDTSAVGLIDHSGHETWFPIRPGDNVVNVDAAVDVTVSFFPPFL